MLNAHSCDVMNDVRRQAYERFKTLGFPTRKEERYKYTDMQALFAPNYGLNLKRLPIPVNPYDAFRCDVPNLSTLLYFVVNDDPYSPARNADTAGRNALKARPNTGEAARSADEERQLGGPIGKDGGAVNAGRLLPEGVVIGSLRELLPRLPADVARYYNQLAGADNDGVTSLNTMLTQDGLLVYVPRNTVVERCVQVINILRADVDLMVNRRVLIVMEPGAEAKLLFCDHTADDHRFLATQVIEAFVGQGARLDLYCMEETHAKNVRVSNVYIRQEADSSVCHNVLTLHNGITRNKLDLQLMGQGAECSCNGCVIADKQQHVDNNTLITHHATHCTSQELYKYVLDEQATGAFAGRVLVEQGAQKTESKMTNQNLCATREARMYTQPMLEIYADDVKCAHGSTVGQLNDAALFYMRQRGITQAEARMLLQNAFINEVIDKMQLEPLRDRLHHLVEKRFRGELNKCEGCKLCK